MELITRLEKFIDAAGQGTPAPDDPITRLEKYYAKIAGEAVETPEPITRIEYYLAKIAGDDVPIPEPITRVEMFLAKIAGADIEPPEPITRIEILLSEWQGGSSWSYDTVTGTSPLSLPSAFAYALQSLIQEGAVEQSTTPTPSSPVDIVCNNGTIKYGALGANLLDPSAANTVLGYYINKSDGAVKDSAYNFMFAGYMPVEAGKTYVAYGRAKNGNDLSDYNRVAWYDSTKTWIEGANYTQNQIAVVTAPNNAAYARFSCNPSGGTSIAVTQGIVDSYNWMFAEGTAEITPFVPFVGGIKADGTPEVLTIGGKNIFSGDIAQFTSQGGAGTTYAYFKLPEEDAEYVLSLKCKKAFSGSAQRYLGFTGDGGRADNGVVWALNSTSSAQVGDVIRTFNLYAGTRRLNFVSIYAKTQAVLDDFAEHFDIQLERGSSVTDYEPYVTPQTASAENLFAVGNYADTQDIISGEVKRNVGVRVLDGTEAISTSNACFTIAISGRVTSKTELLCSHFPYSSKTSSQTDDETIISFSSTNIGFRYDACADKTAFAAFLAAQYAQGTPVIVLYPLATEQTETVEAQALATVEGDNVISVAAEVDGIQLSVSYAKKDE